MRLNWPHKVAEQTQSTFTHMSKCVSATNQVYSLIAAHFSRSNSSFTFGSEPEVTIYYIYCSDVSSSVVHSIKICSKKSRGKTIFDILECQKSSFVQLLLHIYLVCVYICVEIRQCWESTGGAHYKGHGADFQDDLRFQDGGVKCWHFRI